MKILRRLVISCLAAGCAAGAAADDAHPALYSFADVYRLTVSGALPPSFGFAAASAEPQVRAATAQPGPVEPRFTITPVPGSERWMLLLAGVAAAAWVAHRRLTRSY